jgi:hypothetical protein
MLLRIAAVALLALAACHSSDAANTADASSSDPGGWRMASGKEPTRAEFAALAATCQDPDQAKQGTVESCLADLGLKKAP